MEVIIKTVGSVRMSVTCSLIAGLVIAHVAGIKYRMEQRPAARQILLVFH